MTQSAGKFRPAGRGVATIRAWLYRPPPTPSGAHCPLSCRPASGRRCGGCRAGSPRTGRLAYDKNGDQTKAIADFTEVIRLDPKDAGAYSNRGLVVDKY
jgi:hypothetical protein